MASASFTDAFTQLEDALGEAGDTVVLLPLASIDEDPENPRRAFDADELEALAKTIQERRGLLQPITVRPAGPDGRYRLRFGARRLRAAALAGLIEIRALIQVGDPEPAEALMEQLIENDQREGLTTAELARAVERLIALGLSQAEVADRIGRSKAQVSMLASVKTMAPELKGLADQLGLRTLYELSLAWKTDAGRTKVWLAGREPGSITQAEARELAGRERPSRQIVRDPSDGSVRESAPVKLKPGPAMPAAASGEPKAAPAHDAPSGANAVFEVRAPGVTGHLVLANVQAPTREVQVRLSDGSLRAVAAEKIEIVRVRPG